MTSDESDVGEEDIGSPASEENIIVLAEAARSTFLPVDSPVKSILFVRVPPSSFKLSDEEKYMIISGNHRAFIIFKKKINK
jgi:hypothetical protein